MSLSLSPSLCNIIYMCGGMMVYTNLFLKIAWRICEMCDFVRLLAVQYDSVWMWTRNTRLVTYWRRMHSESVIFTTMRYPILMTIIIKMDYRLNGKFRVCVCCSDSVRFRSPCTLFNSFKNRHLYYVLKHTFVAFWVKWLRIWFAIDVVMLGAGAAVVDVVVDMLTHRRDRKQIMCYHKIVCKSCVSQRFASKFDPTEHIRWRWQIKKATTTKNSQLNDQPHAAHRDRETLTLWHIPLVIAVVVC